jgi:inner membrane protein
MRRSLGCLAVIAAADYVILRRQPRWLAIGVVDEPAHVATAALLRKRLNAAYLVGSVLPDLDHVPLALRRKHPQPGDPRPKTHSLIAVVAVAALSRDMAAGMLAHLTRDIALAPGVPLLGGRHVKVPYGAYALLIFAKAYSRSRPC